MDIYDPLGKSLGLPPLQVEIDWSCCTFTCRTEQKWPAWNKGETLEESHKNKISQSLKEHHIKTDATRKKMSKIKKGRTSPNKGKPCPESAKQLKREKMIGRKKPDHMKKALSETRKGSKKIWREDGSWYWFIPSKSVNS